MGSVRKWVTAVACAVMVVVICIILLTTSSSVGEFLTAVFEIAWLAFQGLADFDVAAVAAFIDTSVPFMRNGIFAGAMLIWMGLWKVEYVAWGTWNGILQDVGCVFLYVAGIVNIVSGCLDRRS